LTRGQEGAACDGNYGGLYQRSDEEMLAMWPVAVEETRMLMQDARACHHARLVIQRCCNLHRDDGDFVPVSSRRLLRSCNPIDVLISPMRTSASASW